MTAPLEDHHVHSRWSDDAVDTVDDNLAAAAARGVRVVCISDHVRRATTWVPDYVADVRRAAATSPVTVLCGVEAKLLDATGRLDLPPNLPPLDRVLIADHQFPGPDGPVPPESVRLPPAAAIDVLVGATVAAMRRTPWAQLAHLFSLLPKMGIDEDEVGADHLALLAATARDTGTVVEVNEKWRCPGPAAVAAFRAAGVTVVTSTDSHRAADVGVYGP
ncbi:PHP domain-containing protein [Asanoa sp. WMMD1127]|uniref:PHP domain-containing protein n=1 Tax=Asanoa sp. WMMD1127 TaxID=3016107 RepID=UPI00241793BB|nr:PHP domain-containing protein [Asanoa sp. WMMD1127]MDG4824696.1 PHP domain-containing protein [Asanoa sp. WMMD1127]